MASAIHCSRRTVLHGAAAALLVAVPLRAQAAEPSELAVIVHPANKAGISHDDLVLIFKTSMRFWTAGASGRILALNLPARSDERALFDRVVLKLDPDSSARFWIDRKIRGGEPPPRTVPDPLLVLKLVQQLEAAIGYVPSALVTNKVRVVARVRPNGMAGANHLLSEAKL